MAELVATDAVEELRGRLTGQVLTPADAGYDAARRVHNGLVDRRPAVIARCRDTADVADAVAVGRDTGLELSVRGGGHNVAGRAVADDGLMIDLQPMKGVIVDPGARAVRAQGGVTWGEYNRAAHAHGLATTGGVVSTTGIAGLTLGGGLGWLMGTQGLATDRVRAVELVTADGQARLVTDDTDPDLFWALRGGGGNFGVATSFAYAAEPLSAVTGGLIAHDLSAATDLLRVFGERTTDGSDELGLVYALVGAPDGSGAKLAALAACHSGPPAAAEAELAPVRGFGAPLLDSVERLPYPVMNTLLDDGVPAGARNYWKSAFLAELTDEVGEVLADAMRRAPSDMCQLLVEHIHGAATRVAPTDTAFPHRRPGYSALVVGQWPDPADDEAGIAWVRETFEALRPHTADTSYVNYLDDDDDTARVRAAYGPNWERLAALKARYDPANLFRSNQNIPPAP